MPRISVLMPAYNAEIYIRAAVDSILSQTLSDFELLIFNDCSTDKTDDIIKEYKDSRIVYKNYKEKKGLVYILNQGLSIAKGKYVARMDADDISYPDRFQVQFDYLEKNPDVGICGSWFEYMGGQSGIEKRPVTFEEIQCLLFYGCPLTHPTVMMRNDFLKKYDLKYDQKYYYAEDHEFFFRCSFHFKLVNLPLVLLKYRIHATQIGSAKWMEQLHVKKMIQAKIFAKILTPCSEHDMNWLENYLAEQSIPNEGWLNQVAFYKNRIITENEKNMLYPHPMLLKVVNEIYDTKIENNFYKYYFRKYYNQKLFNFSLLKSFLKEKYKPYKYLGLKLTLFFIIKCLVNYKINNTISV